MVSSFPLPSIFFFPILALLLQGCVPLNAQISEEIDPFDFLHQRELSQFEHALAMERYFQSDDSWTAVGEALLDLATCDPVREAGEESLHNPLAELARQLVQIEDLRRQRMIRAAIEGGPRVWHRGTIHTRFTSQTYFHRSPSSIDTEFIHWPRSRDTWIDESPAPVKIPYHCETLPDRTPPPLPAPFAQIPSENLFGHLLAEFLATDQAYQEAEQLSQTPGLAQTRAALALHRADLVILLREHLPEDKELSFLAEISLKVLSDLPLFLALLQPEEPNAALPTSRPNLNRFSFALRQAHLASDLDDFDARTPALRTLLDFPGPIVAETANYLLLRHLWEAGHWDQASELFSELLPLTSPYHSAHAYFAATSQRFAGHEEVFLGLAREALRNRSRPRSDPFLGALYREVLQQIVLFEVDARTLEILEELGPRAELRERTIELAEVSLDSGRPEVARELILPLLAETTDARRRPRLLAILALGAFLQGDRPTFDTHLLAISDRPAALDAVIPRRRRAAFFAHQDAELARVLRAMLPIMAEWGDDSQSRRRRQLWLTAIVEHTQRFLRWAPETTVSTPLTELYELASQLLEEHPRGYAQRVGRQPQEASPLILGTVSLATHPSLDDAPDPRLRWPPVDSLLMIPYGGRTSNSFVHDLSPEVLFTGEDAK